jgi:hypothetical protein
LLNTADAWISGEKEEVKEGAPDRLAKVKRAATRRTKKKRDAIQESEGGGENRKGEEMAERDSELSPKGQRSVQLPKREMKATKEGEQIRPVGKDESELGG